MHSIIHRHVGSRKNDDRLFQFGRWRERNRDFADTAKGCHIQSRGLVIDSNLYKLDWTSKTHSFQVITIEHDVLKEGKLGLRKFMEERGYIFYRTVSDANFVAGDSIFVHHSVQLTEAQLAIVGTDTDDFRRPSRN